MKKSIGFVLAGFLFLPTVLFATENHYVQPYTKSNGTYVQGHYQTSPDSNIYNNYSTRGNVNPYTGKEGTVNPYAIPSTYTVPAYNNNGYGTYNNWGNTRR